MTGTRRLAAFLIVRRHATPAEIARSARAWLAYVPGGFSGEACNTAGGCERRFSNDGCGGMDERNRTAAR